MEQLTHLSLFSGIGGLDLAAEYAGFRTVGQCEWADYPHSILQKHWPDVPKWRDIRQLTMEDFYARTGLRTVDIVSGGFPCQPFSVAGKRRGEEDDRYLWPEMLRVCETIKPRWIIGENVAGIVNMALDKVLSDLETIGYTARAFVFPACAVDAPHRRDRVAIVAYAESERIGGRIGLPNETRRDRLADGRETVAYSNSRRCDRDERREHGCKPENGCWRAVESRLGRMVDGFSDRVDKNIGFFPAEPADVPRVVKGMKGRTNRLKCLGNAVVWKQFYPMFEAIREIERMMQNANGADALILAEADCRG